MYWSACVLNAERRRSRGERIWITHSGAVLSEHYLHGVVRDFAKKPHIFKLCSTRLPPYRKVSCCIEALGHTF